MFQLALDSELEKKDIVDVFLQPGDYHFGHGNTRIRTILGSCVSIIMWHPKLKIGGMCHYMLPKRASANWAQKKNNVAITKGRHNAILEQLDGRYADEAMRYFLHDIQQTNTVLSDYHVWLIGGGNMFPTHKNHLVVDVGGRNITVAHELAKKYHLRIVAEHLGGYGHRQVAFTLWDGKVWTKQFEQQLSPLPADSTKQRIMIENITKNFL